MPSLRETLHALLAVQSLDSRLARLQKSLNALDDGTGAAAAARAASEILTATTNALHKISGDLKDSELKQSAVETKQKSYQQKLYQGTVTSAKELANIEKEIAALGRQRSDLDDKILTAMEREATAQDEVKLARTNADETEKKRAEAITKFQTESAAMRAQAATLTNERAEAVKEFSDPALLKRYEDLRAKAGGVGIVKIEEGACGGCHTTLPGGVIKAVKESDSVQTCENCRRLLTD